MQPRAATASRHHPEKQPGPPEAATAAVPAPLTGARPSLSGSPFHGGQGRHHRLRGPVRTHAVRPLPPPSPERVGQGRHGRNPHFDISAQRFCAGLGQSSLQLANRLPDGPVAGHVSRRPVFFRNRIVPDADISAACNNLARLDDDGKTLHMTLRGCARPARGTNLDRGGDLFATRARVAGTCNSTPVNRERSTRVGPEVCRVKEPDFPLLGCDQDARLIYSRAEPFGPIPFHFSL